MKVMSVYIDGSDNDRDSLRLATMFCRRVGGRLDVVYPQRPEIYVTPVSIAVPEDQDTIGEAKRAFDDVCAGVEGVSWVPVDAGLADAIRGYSFLHDVIILERVRGEEGPDVLALNTALFETSAAVLVCPPDAPASVGRSVAVVWNGTAQSARALHAATPILESAEQVTVLVNCANAAAEPFRVLSYLEARGIAASAEEFDGDVMTARGRGRAILEATHGEADLLVMGAFGENMLSSIMGLGRTTQKVCTATKIPTLICN